MTHDTAIQSELNAPRYSPLALANTFIQRYGQTDGIQHMKLQKLCYFTYGWWLALRHQQTPPLLTEQPQVWQYGPVFNSLYNVLKTYGKRPIKTPEKDDPFADSVFISDPEVIKLIDWIWYRYGHYSAEALSNLTHEIGTPWRQIAEEHKFRITRNFPIDNDRIREYFSNEHKQMKSSA